jgi:hypothetical protein
MLLNLLFDFLDQNVMTMSASKTKIEENNEKTLLHDEYREYVSTWNTLVYVNVKYTCRSLLTVIS